MPNAPLQRHRNFFFHEDSDQQNGTLKRAFDAIEQEEKPETQSQKRVLLTALIRLLNVIGENRINRLRDVPVCAQCISTPRWNDLSWKRKKISLCVFLVHLLNHSQQGFVRAYNNLKSIAQQCFLQQQQQQRQQQQQQQGQNDTEMPDFEDQRLPFAPSLRL